MLCGRVPIKKSKSMDFLILLKAKISSFNFPKSESSLENNFLPPLKCCLRSLQLRCFRNPVFFFWQGREKIWQSDQIWQFSYFRAGHSPHELMTNVTFNLIGAEMIETGVLGVVTVRRGELYWLGGDVSGLVSPPPLIGYNAKSQFRPPSHNLRLDSEYF